MPSFTKADLQHIISALPWKEWTIAHTEEMADDSSTIVDDAGSAAADEISGSWSNADPFVSKHVSGYVGDEITGVDEYTRERIVDVLFEALDGDGLPSMTELASMMKDALDGSYVLSPARALTIARTETATLLNIGQLAAYHQNGIDFVEVSDGDGDEDCAAADGAIWTLEEALDNPLEHPNCTRSFSPVDAADAEDAE